MAVFYISAGVAAAATILVIVQRNAVHALLYLILSLLAVAVIFYGLGAPFAAALEAVVYAGAIMVLFVFVVMMLNVGGGKAEREAALRPGAWIVPAALALVLLAELVLIITRALPAVSPPPAAARPAAGGVPPREVGLTLFGPYLLGVELASVLLLAGLVSACHLGRGAGPRPPAASPGAGAAAGEAGADDGPAADEEVRDGAIPR